MLLVCNLTAADVVLVRGKRSVTVPAKVGALTYGPSVNISSELEGLIAGDYTALEVQRPGVVAYFWSNGIPEYAVGALTVGANVNGVTVQNTTTTVTPIVEARQAIFLGPAVADLVAVVNAVLPADGVQVIVANSIDYARKLQVRIVTGSTAGTLTLVGVGVNGQAVTQAIDISTAGGTRTVVTTHAYRSLTSATVSGINTPAGTIGIGLGLGLALPTAQASVTAFGVIGANVDKVNEAVGTVDATAYTVEPTTAANGTRNYTFNYRFTLTPVNPAHNHSLA
jgi:hypothetical protein